MRISIIINNFNYGQFLADAIQSALRQTWQDVQVIVVDDGSTDHSREIIAGFGNQVLPVFKENGGQASAFNSGFGAADGECILFLDSDDTLEPEAASCIIETFRQKPEASRVQVRMTLMDVNGDRLGAEEPAGHLASGDWAAQVLALGPSCYPSVPTSASAWPRWFCEKVLPMPEESYKIAADAYLKNTAPLYGMVCSIQATLTNYRVHGSSASHILWDVARIGQRLALDASLFEADCRAIADHSHHLSKPASAEYLITRRWQHMVRRLILWRLKPEEHPHPGMLKVLRAIHLSGTFLKIPLIYAFVAFVRLGPKSTAMQAVARLFAKEKIGESLDLPTALPGEESTHA